MTENNESDLKRRRYPRLKARVLYRPSKIIGQKHQASNVSLGGMRIYSNKYYAVGQTINIELSLPSGQSSVALTRVAWIDAYPKDSDALYDLGLEFIHLPTHALRELELELSSKDSK